MYKCSKLLLLEDNGLNLNNCLLQILNGVVSIRNQNLDYIDLKLVSTEDLRVNVEFNGGSIGMLRIKPTGLGCDECSASINEYDGMYQIVMIEKKGEDGVSF